jgi:hypothetical protein
VQLRQLCAAALTALTLFSLDGLTTPVRAQAPTVRYSPEGTRQLIFVNNPERLEVGFTDTVIGSQTFGVTFNDLADADQGKKAILQQTIQPGSYRNLFEHVYNLSRATTPLAANNPIHYGICLYNPNKTAISVTVYGKAFVAGTNGGQPLAELLNAAQTNPTGTTLTVFPAQTVWVFRSDVDIVPAVSVPPGSFFSGVVDFDVAGGPAVVSNLAYQVFSDKLGRPPVFVAPPFDALAACSGE